jgi:hypothetical protein
MQTLSIYDRSCSLFNILDIFSFGSCVQGVKTIQGTKTFLKTLENDACVHIALFFNIGTDRDGFLRWWRWWSVVEVVECGGVWSSTLIFEVVDEVV